MKKVVKGIDSAPIKMWLEDIEDGAMEQAANLAELPFLYRHVALMPDCHQGYGMPIGGVIALENVVIPNAVGVDIGCGMCACKTSLKIEDINEKILKKIMSEIRKVIPLGKNHHKEKQNENWLTTFLWNPYKQFGSYPVIAEQWESIHSQIGTLGGGNHFIEIQKDPEGFVWIMLHSGSRNIGKRVADYHNKIAQDLNKKWYSNVDSSHQLAFLPLNSDEGIAYMREMSWCVEFAKRNRNIMLRNIVAIIANNLGKSHFTGSENVWDVAHNYAALENHFGKNVVVHRKGATRARAGELGIIPGSQGTKSYIVEGLGNPESFMSCSHGAGRAMSRTKARTDLDLQTEINKMNEKGIIHSIRNIEDLDEASSAYKDIDVVMENQKDLVKINVELTPIAVIKGD